MPRPPLDRTSSARSFLAGKNPLLICLSAALAFCLALGLPGESFAQSSKKAASKKEAAKKEDAQKQAEKNGEEDSLLSAKTFSGLELRSIGPAFMSGRISDIAVDPRDQSTWYVAVGSGGVWKTENAGTTWTPIFDDQGSYSIGCVSLDPQRPDTVWVGTGENVGGRHVAFGDGVYRSLDGGITWKNMGLEESGHIGTIIVHPEDSNVVYVAAQGPLWYGGGQRGLFKTTDGGESWERILGGGPDHPYTGVNEVRMDPRDPDVLYASTHQRLRTVAALINSGPGSGIHKSLDGGKTWRELTEGLPKEDMGKIGLAISPQNPDVIYATVETVLRKGGFYRSTDAGASWEKRSDYLSGGTGPHYYQEIFADPHHEGRVYQMDADLHVTHDGGMTFTEVPERAKHGDNHAMAFDPNDPDYLLVGSDGGLYESWDQGQTWKYISNLPVTQFYKIAVDNDSPIYHIYGGTQDNSTQGVPSRTLNVSGIRNSDWFITLFADGHQPATDPSNPDIVYSEWQQGNLVRYDRTTGEIVYIQPQPDAGEPAERWNWDSPILVSPHDPKRLYFASQRVWRSDDRGDSWRPISGDLSRGLNRLTQPMMGRTWSYEAGWDLSAMSFYGNVTSLSESPRVEGLLYAGTDDGLVHVTEDGGETWRRAGALSGVPEGAFVNDIKADLHDADTVRIALDHHKSGDFRPFLLESNDRGRTWRSIAGDLPDRHLVWRLVQDHVKPELMFAGTEFGVFFTPDGGKRWIELEGGVPQISFRDLAIQQRENDLVGGTFGRGIFILDDYTPLRSASEETLSREAVLYPVKDAWWYLPETPLGRGAKGTQGEDYFTADNPPYGAVFTYYLRDGLQTRREQRREAERKIVEEGGDTLFPGWEEILSEEQEWEPAVVFTVRDAEGNLVRRFDAPAKKGFHRAAWDLRYPHTQAWQPDGGGGFFRPQGILAPPGTYTVEMALSREGELTPVGEKQTFEVVSLRDTVLPRTDPARAAKILAEAAELGRRVSGASEALKAADRRLDAIHEVLERSTADPALAAEARTLHDRLRALAVRLEGNPLEADIGEPVPPSISGRLQVVGMGNRNSTYGPTPHHLKNLEIAKTEFEAVRGDLEQLIEVDLEAFEDRLDAAGVPWTPGRGVPE